MIKVYRGQSLKIAIGIMVLAILLLADSVDAATLIVDKSGNANYTNIQDAINNASDGDTILVYSGTYYENVNVTRWLILKGVDTGGGKPVVNASGSDSAITLSAGWTMLEGFAAYGIRVISNSNIIRNNTVSNSYYGIDLFFSSSNTLSNNTVSNNSNYGISLQYSSNNILSGNNVHSNGNGISLVHSNNSILTGNNASNSNRSITLYNSSDNLIIDNIVSDNLHGISLNSSSNNAIYNNLFDNANNIEIADSINKWNITITNATNIIGGHYLGGNFWANPNGRGFSQTCPDSDYDGICDSSYGPERDNIDYLPLAQTTGQNKKAAGFEVILAITAILAVAYIFGRKRR